MCSPRPGGRTRRRHSDAYRFRKVGYGGAAPLKRETHRYIFTVHAGRRAVLTLMLKTPAAMVGFNVHFHSLASALDHAMFVKCCAGWRA
ncbi:hypothetical protein KCP73_03385 [Salmonella enterica subsp. enterica]|nr:hypothetical protein KCP73_03385 [Salmonella enterica subsp. enterica]